MKIILKYLKYSVLFAYVQFTYATEFSFHSDHECSKSPQEEACSHILKLATPGPLGTSDIIVVPHRGLWGSYQASYWPENSSDSFEEARRRGFYIIESDFMLTEDNEVVASHDYDLYRASGYTGNKLVKDMTLDEVQQLTIKYRDGSASNANFMKLEEVLSLAKLGNWVLALDLKGMVAEYIDGKCIKYCEYNDTKNRLWFELLSIVVEKIISEDATKNVVIKTDYTPSQIINNSTIQGESITGIGEDNFNKIVWIPRVGASSQDIDGSTLVLNYIEAWDQKSNNYALIETRYKTENDILLQRFSYGKERPKPIYMNILHYIYENSNRRSGIFVAEPMGRRGGASRFGKWVFSDPRKDFRADFKTLRNIHYFEFSVITADNPLAWKQLE